MNIYIICAIAYFGGQMLSAMEKVSGLRTKYPQLSPGTIVSTYLRQEWNTIIVSFVIMGLCQLSLYIALSNGRPGPGWFWLWGVYVLALILGYAGQRLVYKYMKTTEQALEKKISGNDEKQVS